MREAPSSVPAEMSLEVIKGLLALGTSSLPISLEATEPRYKLISAGLFARVLTLGESIVHLAALRRSSDLLVLVRALYEHAVVLAWVSGPRNDSRAKIFERNTIEQSLKLDADVRNHGHTGFDEEDRSWFQSVVADVGGPGMPPLARLAEEADRDWYPHISPSDSRGLRRSYSIVYRFGSTVAHPSMTGLWPFIERTDTHLVVVIEPEGDTEFVLPTAVTYLAHAIAVSSAVLGKPRWMDAYALLAPYWLEVERHEATA